MATHAAFTAINVPRVTDTIYQLLREKIVARELAPGSKINVDEIARQLEVSRTPVHEALTVLATDGLVEVRPRKGTFVSEFTIDDYRETLDIRRALELLAAETVLDHLHDDDVKGLRTLIRDMERVVAREEDPAEAARIHAAMNLEFHLRLVRLSGNRRLLASYEDLRAHLRIARAHLDAHDWFARVDLEAEEHEAILRALETRDAQRLHDTLRHHLTRSATSLIDDVIRSERRP